MAVPYPAFAEQYQRFKEIVRRESGGKEFVSFREGLPAKHEDYKEPLRREARRRMDLSAWRLAHVGTGRILAKVVDAIEINDPRSGFRNNLVRWPNQWGPSRRAHSALLEATNDPHVTRDFEQWFLSFFKSEVPEDSGFESFVQLAGRRYDLVAYLYFLKSSDRFMPIATETFDKAFVRLGVDLVTSHRCSWENYSAYNAVLGEVRDLLADEGVPNVQLVDAHSFCWMLVRQEAAGENTTPRRLIAKAPVALAVESGVVQAPERPGEPIGGSIVTEAELWEDDRRRRALGRIAEAKALESERTRLRNVGHRNPELAATLVSDQLGLGYDIRSEELDGSARHIEVKAARGPLSRLTFFLTRNEWEKSRYLPNFHLYLVLNADEAQPTVLDIEASHVTSACLVPVSYHVCIRPAHAAAS